MSLPYSTLVSSLHEVGCLIFNDEELLRVGVWACLPCGLEIFITSMFNGPSVCYLHILRPFPLSSYVVNDACVKEAAAWRDAMV